MTRGHRSDEQQFDVCLSFAGEDRQFVRAVADHLKAKGVRVFFDEYEEIGLWGKDLYEHLDDVYKNAARYCVIFASRSYAKKLWTSHERRSAQERALKENREYILPARFDKTPIPGLRDTVGYVSLRKHSPQSFAELVRLKVGGHFRKEYLPPVPDILFKMVGAKSKAKQDETFSSAHSFLTTLRRMSAEERKLLYHLVRNACPAELPKNVHINIDLLRRISSFPTTKIRRLLGGLQSLGFSTTVREDDENPPGELGSSEMLVLEWHDLSLLGTADGAGIAHAMIWGATQNYCEEHGLMAWERLDFSQLSSSTAVVDDHAHAPKRRPTNTTVEPTRARPARAVHRER